jgi:hypothetical protein
MKVNREFLAGALLIGFGSLGGLGSAVANEDYYSQGEGMYGWQDQSDRIEQRLDNQRHRILQGFRSGQLTRDEFGRLMQENRAIRRQERQYLADGQMSRFEYDHLDRQLDQANQHIRFERHDQDTRGYWHGYRSYD